MNGPAARVGQILVIDDEPGALKVTSTILRKDGHTVDTSLNAVEALETMESRRFDCVLVDFKMPEMDGLEFIDAAREKGYTVPIIMVTAFGSVKMAVESMRRGAYNYLTKPINFDELRLLVQQAVARSIDERDLVRLRETVARQSGLELVVGRSTRMRDVMRLAETVADTDANVLILGETGTGKGVIAKSLHTLSRRRDGPFVHVNCGALPENLLESELFGHERGAFTGAVKTREGRFERANGGTIFLDEIGNMPLALQSKLLRVLQEGEYERVGGDRTLRVDVRVLAATNEQLELAVSQRRFREDLYYRLNVVPIRVPPLRERPEDIPLLTNHFVKRFSQLMNKNFESVSSRVMERLAGHAWPGNVRELENLIERAVILGSGPVLDNVDLEPPEHDPRSDEALEWDYDMPLKSLEQQVLTKLERDYITEMLRRFHGNIGLASRQSGITRRSLYEKMKELGIKKEDFKKL